MATINKKIIYIIVLPLIFLSILTTAITLYTTNKYLINKTFDELLSESESEVSNLEKTLHEIESAVSVLSISAGMLFKFDFYITREDQYLSEYRDLIAPLFLKTAEAIKDCKGTYFMFSPGFGTLPSQVWYNDEKSDGKYERIIEFPNPNDYDRANSNMDYYFNTIDQRKPSWSDPYIDMDINEAMVSYTIPVYVNKNIIGIVGIDLSLESIAEHFNNYRYLENGYALLLNSNADIIYHPKFTFGSKLDEVLEDKLDFLIKDFKSGKRQNTLVYNLEGQNKRLGYTRMDNNWIVAIAIEENEMFRPVFSLQKILITINIFILLLTILSSLIFSKFITKPLQILTAEIKKSVYNYNNILEYSDLLLRNDEIGEMFLSFLELQNTNKEMIERVINNNITLERLAHLGDKVGAFTHELKTPIGVILTALTFSDDLVDQLKKDINNNTLKKSDLDYFLSKFYDSNNLGLRNTKQANKIIANFKSIAVSGSNLKWEEVELKKLIQEYIQNFTLGNKSIKIDFILNIDSELKISSCPGYLGQVFTNLIQNSIKHGFLDRDSGEISIAAYLKESYIHIEYSDNGIGIPKDFVSEIFKPYFTSAKDRGGTGLGLHIIQTIIKSHLNGSIEFIHSDNPGVLFNIKLPEA